MRLAPACAVFAFAAIGLASTTASAADDDLILRPRHKQFESPQHFYLELRFAPYKPQIDDDPALHANPDLGVSNTPWKDTFRDNARLLAALEFDWQIFRLPYIGTVGAGASIGYTRMSAKAPKLDPAAPLNNEPSGSNTTLELFPMYAIAVLRADVFMREMGIPFVPYGKAGIGYVPWRTFTEGGTSYSETPDGTVHGKGQTWGLHLAVGLAFQLDVIDRYTAKNLDQTLGINHSYLYGEWMFANYRGIGQSNVLWVGTSTWVTGLAFEF
ncbi:MXAN_2562 family outer membrane beta-barrel protein [Pendulispora rubella]|uniref:MXAN_2562 family outer membrane beta-barrel protein n=1 Tax=Pendulispora rubella TaxID=2741070 RepID=A0ABZ2L8I0_9BACT